MDGVHFVEMEASRQKTINPLTIPSTDGNGLVSQGHYFQRGGSTEMPSVDVGASKGMGQTATQKLQTKKRRPRSRLAIKFDTP